MKIEPIKMERYRFGNYIMEVEERYDPDLEWYFWLYQKNSGVKELMFGMPADQTQAVEPKYYTKEEAIELAIANVWQYIDKDTLRMTHDEAVSKALTLLGSDENLFCDMVDAMNDYSGFAECFKCYDMEELDDYYDDLTITEFLSRTNSFTYRDKYFYNSVDGIESTNDKAGLYHENAPKLELLEALVDCKKYIAFPSGTEELQMLLDIIKTTGEAE